MDQVFPFHPHPEDIQVINPRTDCPGLLELHVIEGGNSAFLYRGAWSEEDVSTDIDAVTPSFSIAANIYHPGFLVWDGNESQFTVYAPESTGFVRISEIPCGCK